MVKIFCKNTGTYKEFQEGTMLLDMINEFDFEKPYEIIAARVNNVAQGLKFRAYQSRDSELPHLQRAQCLQPFTLLPLI